MIRWRLALAAIGSLALAGAAFEHFALAKGVFVHDRRDARWLVAETGRWPGVYWIEPRTVAFRTAFRVDPTTPPIELALRAVERAVVDLDGEKIYRDEQSDPRGRIDRKVSLGALSQ